MASFRRVLPPQGAEADPSTGGLPIALLFRGFVLLLAVSFLTGAPAQAEAPPVPPTERLIPADSSEASALEDRTRFRPHAMLLGGVGGLGGDARHPFGGVEIGGFFGRFGALAIGQYGDGNGFRSILLAGGPAVELADVGFASFSAYAGLARYEEELETGFERDVGGPYAALTARIPLRVGAIGLTLSLWRGSLDGEGFERPTTVTGRRLSVGFGW